MFYGTRIILGSKSNWKVANLVLGTLKEFNIMAKVSIASCHWHTGGGFEKFILGLEEDLIVYVGGMQFAAPGIAETINKINLSSHKLILAVPTDRIARHACEDFPLGTVVFIAGYNSIIPEHGYQNSALAVAKMLAWRYPELRPKVQAYFNQMRQEKPLIEEILLANGLIPESKKS